MRQWWQEGWENHALLGCSDIKIDYSAKQFLVNGKTVSEGDTITVDGSTGNVYTGRYTYS
uniref:hypothetical protein n=1 Tax=Candidatus Nitrosotalea sp. TS TaxID=2341020 RepID=UPI0021070E9D